MLASDGGDQANPLRSRPVSLCSCLTVQLVSLSACQLVHYSKSGSPHSGFVVGVLALGIVLSL